MGAVVFKYGCEESRTIQYDNVEFLVLSTGYLNHFSNGTINGVFWIQIDPLTINFISRSYDMIENFSEVALCSVYVNILQISISKFKGHE